MDKLVDALFRFVTPKRPVIIRFFKVFYFIELLVILLVLYLGLQGNELYFKFSGYGNRSGEVALCLYIVTLIPGMARRFHFKHKLLALIMIFRRYLGIAMYLTLTFHILVKRVIPMLKLKIFVPFENFELAGLIASVFLFFLFLTSNDFSLKKLKVWWYRLHKLIYVVMWFILFHVGMQSISLWTIIMFLTVLLMSFSFVYERVTRNKQ